MPDGTLGSVRVAFTRQESLGLLRRIAKPIPLLFVRKWMIPIGLIAYLFYGFLFAGSVVLFLSLAALHFLVVMASSLTAKTLRRLSPGLVFSIGSKEVDIPASPLGWRKVAFCMVIGTWAMAGSGVALTRLW